MLGLCGNYTDGVSKNTCRRWRHLMEQCGDSAGKVPCGLSILSDVIKKKYVAQ